MPARATRPQTWHECRAPSKCIITNERKYRSRLVVQLSTLIDSIVSRWLTGSVDCGCGHRRQSQNVAMWKKTVKKCVRTWMACRLNWDRVQVHYHFTRLLMTFWLLAATNLYLLFGALISPSRSLRFYRLRSFSERRIWLKNYTIPIQWCHCAQKVSISATVTRVTRTQKVLFKPATEPRLTRSDIAHANQHLTCNAATASHPLELTQSDGNGLNERRNGIEAEIKHVRCGQNRTARKHIVCACNICESHGRSQRAWRNGLSSVLHANLRD